MGTLSREDILSRMAEMPREEVEVPELGGTVYIRVMNLREIKEINRLRDSNPNNHLAVYPKVLLLGCCNADGSPMFQPQDIAAFDGGMWPAIDKIVKEIFYLNKVVTRPKDEGVGEDDAAEAPKAEMSINGSR